MDETGAAAPSNENPIDESNLLNPEIQTGNGNNKNGGNNNLRRGHLGQRNDYLVPRLPTHLGYYFLSSLINYIFLAIFRETFYFHFLYTI